ncbi:MAG: DNA mismatch repair protein MutS [Bacteroidales bacterium]|nr:DNA mismatch repair protein MutS [Bacteroidales bacterium]
MILNRKNKKQKLINNFGKLKDDSFDFESIERYFRKKEHTENFQILSDKTCNDLDFQELFMFIDRTNSKVGQQFIYNKLRTIPLKSESVNIQEKIIGEFINNEEFRVSIQSKLSKLDDFGTYYITSLFQDEHLKPPKWFFVVPVLSFTVILSLIFVFFNPQLIFVLLSVFIVNIVIHYWNKKNLYQYLSSLPQLLRLKNIAKKLFDFNKLKELNPKLIESVKVINKIRNRMLFFKLESNIQGEFQALFWMILELFKILFLIEPLLLFGVLKRLDTKRKEIEDLYLFIGEIDSLISIASLRVSENGYCIPQISQTQKQLIAEKAYHPLIIDCVSNNIQVNEKSILLTGSNMSGKTSFIRTIGINVITGLTLNTCFAEHFSMPYMQVFSAIRISDDLMNDKSYYFEEVLTIKKMIEESINGKPNLFLLDELFKGTNTVERISAGKAVLSTLNNTNNIVFVSTHDIELADLLNDEYELYHFSEKVDDKSIDFDYKLKDGKLKNRNAIKILEINDYPENIITEAIEISKELDKYSVPNSIIT